jgi:hypothetical protein
MPLQSASACTMVMRAMATCQLCQTQRSVGAHATGRVRMLESAYSCISSVSMHCSRRLARASKRKFANVALLLRPHLLQEFTEHLQQLAALLRLS